MNGAARDRHCRLRRPLEQSLGEGSITVLTSMKNLTQLLVAAFFIAMTAASASAQIKYVAVVETEVDEQSGAAAKLNKAEVRQVTAELRNVAVKNLPRDIYNIMTSETVISQGSAKLEECAEENCVIALGATIGADYIVRGIVSKLGTSLTLSVEMYETEDGNLVATSGLVRSENIAELVDKAAVVCADMYKTFVSSQRSKPKTQATQATYTVTVDVNPPNSGYVSRNPDKTEYDAGEKLSLTATAYDGYTFTSWSGASGSTKTTLTGLINNDMTLTANFSQTPELEPNPEPSAPKPYAGIAQAPPAKKNLTLVAVGLDVLGAGILVYGINMESNVKDNINAMMWSDAENSAKQRNIAYTIGTIILLSGISVHILF